MNWKTVIALICAVVLIAFGFLFILGTFVPTAKHIKQDAWISEKPDEQPPIAVLMFTFTSKGDFAANHPIHVRIQMWVTVGINFSDVAICFPDSYAYPRHQTPGKPPDAGIFPISENGDRIGEGDIEFTSEGSFGYIIYSEDEPVYYAADQEIIHVLPHQNIAQLELSHKTTGITLIGIGVSLILGAIGLERRKIPGKIRINVRKSWDLELEEETLGDGTVTAVVTSRGGHRSITLENIGESATTLRSVKIVKKSWIPMKSVAEAEITWRRDFSLYQINEKGSFIQFSIYRDIEPGHRVDLSLPYVNLLDVMLDNNMLDLKNEYQGRFMLLIEHVFGQAKSNVFKMNLSKNLRRFISERQEAFGHIIARDVPENE